MNKTLRDVLLLILLVFALRVPFLNQAVGGDEPYYLAAAEHAQIDPWHPNHTTYIYEGREVTFRGYPHPPGNAWFQAAMLALCGDIREVPFHTGYILFSLIAVLAVYALGRKFSTQPLLAALLFLAVPVFVINGNTMESDLPYVSLLLAGFAFYVWERRIAAACLLALAAMVSYQSFLALPILLLYDRKGLRSWLPAATPILTLIAWQVFEKITSGQFPAEVTAGYLSSEGLNRLPRKIENALGLFVHSWFMIFPLLVPAALYGAWKRREWFLGGWIVLYLGAAMVLFYSGAARYVFPIAAPLALLASRMPKSFVWPGFALQLILSVSLATVNYQQWNAYRDFARALDLQPGHTWANGEWGLRFYLEEKGALPLHRNQLIAAGDMVVTNDLGYPVSFRHGGSRLVSAAAADVDSTVPLRLIGIGSHAGYATAAQGFLPFAIAFGPIDHLHAERLVEKKPVRSWLDMSAADFEDHAISGTYSLEGNSFRWVAGTSSFLLKAPAAPARVAAEFSIHEMAKARKITLLVDNRPVATLDCPGPGTYNIQSAAPVQATGAVQITLQADKSFSVPGDSRTLALILTGIGFRAN